MLIKMSGLSVRVAVAMMMSLDKGQWSRDIIMAIVTGVRPLFVLCNSLPQVPLCDLPVTAVSMPTVFPFGEIFLAVGCTAAK